MIDTKKVMKQIESNTKKYLNNINIMEGSLWQDEEQPTEEQPVEQPVEQPTEEQPVEQPVETQTDKATGKPITKDDVTALNNWMADRKATEVTKQSFEGKVNSMGLDVDQAFSEILRIARNNVVMQRKKASEQAIQPQ